MTTGTIPGLIQAEVLQGDFVRADVEGVYTSDLLSDVLANGRNTNVLVTIQAHKNTVAVATVVDISLIIICNSRPIIDDMVTAASEAKIGIVRTKLSQFEVSGLLWSALQRERSAERP